MKRHIHTVRACDGAVCSFLSPRLFLLEEEAPPLPLSAGISALSTSFSPCLCPSRCMSLFISPHLVPLASLLSVHLLAATLFYTSSSLIFAPMQSLVNLFFGLGKMKIQTRAIRVKILLLSFNCFKWKKTFKFQKSK